MKVKKCKLNRSLKRKMSYKKKETMRSNQIKSNNLTMEELKINDGDSGDISPEKFSDDSVSDFDDDNSSDIALN